MDERSDIYSLGIVLYEMLTGQVPFDGDNPVQVALMHINDDIVPPSKLVPGIPPALEKLVMKATDKFQSNRYKNADELLEDLQNIEFVTKMVGDSVFAASDVEEFQEMNRKKHSEVDFVEEKPKKKKKKKGNGKKKIVIAAIAGVIAVIAVVIGILYAFGVIGGGIEVPNLVGMTTEEAEAELNELGLKMEVGEEVPSDEIEEGLIASQTPDEGETVEEGDTVTVMLSSGKPTGQVPSLVGRPYDEDSIRALLEASNYQLGSVTYQESDAEEGEIINQDPGAGTEAEEGTSVNVVVSKGTDKRTVPTLVGLSVDEAKQAIVDAGFTVGSISYAESTVYKQNIVMEQQYDAGEKLEEGTKINIVVSKGEPEVVTPPEETDPGTGEGGGDTETGGDEEGSTS